MEWVSGAAKPRQAASRKTRKRTALFINLRKVYQLNGEQGRITTALLRRRGENSKGNLQSPGFQPDVRNPAQFAKRTQGCAAGEHVIIVFFDIIQNTLIKD